MALSVILDACRNNPFVGRGLRTAGGGLAQMQAPEGTLIAYATQPGNVAQDGTDGHSPYTRALASAVRKPGLDVFAVFNQTALEVKQRTGGVQQPWMASSPIAGQFYFTSAPHSQSTDGHDNAVEIAFWNSVKDAKTPDVFQAYLQQYPQGKFASLATLKIKELTELPKPGPQVAVGSSPQQPQPPATIAGNDGAVVMLPEGSGLPPPGTPSTSWPQTLHRRALIIGNATYPHIALRNPLNDATDMADTLRRLGFGVILLRDADKRTMDRAVEDFTNRVPRGSVGLFYFSGHAAQIEGQNFLIPVGAALSEPSDAKYRAVAADWILARMDDTGMEVKLLIFDACRNSPFGRSWSPALKRGLVTMDSPQGSLIAYSTSPGQTVEDGSGRNSLYTAHLLREIPQPGRSIELMFKAVRNGVRNETKGQQTPWETSSLVTDFLFTR
jgi:uncharacterized caspase-like protein